MNLFVCGLRRSGTTILYDALSEDPELRCFYEPLREDSETIGGGSGAHPTDLSAETRELREAFRATTTRSCRSSCSTGAARGRPRSSSSRSLPEHVRGLLTHLLELAPDVAIKETRFHHKLGAVAGIDPDAALVHLVRDPRAVAASMLLGRRRRTDIYPDAETFFTARTGRRLWSSRRISEDLIARRRSSLDLPADIPDFLRPLLVWKSAFETMAGDGPRLFGDRYALLRLEDLRTDPGAGLERIYGLIGRTAPDRVAEWVAANLRRDAEIHLARRPPLGARGPPAGDGARARGGRLRRDPRARAGAGGATQPHPTGGPLPPLGVHGPSASPPASRLGRQCAA